MISNYASLSFCHKLFFKSLSPKFDKDDGSKKMFFPPSIKIIKAGYLKKEKFKGVIFTDISHHSIFPNKVRKQIVSLFKKSDYVTNKKKWNTKKKGDKRIKEKNSINHILVIPAGKPFNLKNKKGA